MQEKVKYLSLMSEKYRQLGAAHPGLLRDLEQREKFYLDMIYTLMTKNRFLEENLLQVTKYCKSLQQQEVSIKQKISSLVNKSREKGVNQETQKVIVSEQSLLAAPFRTNNVQLGSKQLTQTVTTKRPASQKQDQQSQPFQIVKSMDTRRNMYLQQEPPHQIYNNPEKTSRMVPARQEVAPSRKFKDQIIKTLNSQSKVYAPKRVTLAQDLEDRKSLKSSTSSQSSSKRHLSCKRYLGQTTPLQHPLQHPKPSLTQLPATYSIKRRL